MDKESLKYLFEEVEKQIDFSHDYFRKMKELIKVFSEVEKRIEIDQIEDIREGLNKPKVKEVTLSDAVEKLSDEFKKSYKLKKSYCQQIEKCMKKAFEQKGIEPLSVAALNAMSVGASMFINEFIEDVDYIAHKETLKDNDNPFLIDLEELSNLGDKEPIKPKDEEYTYKANNVSKPDPLE